MNHNCKVETIKSVLLTPMNDEVKIYFIQSYLLGYVSEEELQRVIVSSLQRA